MSDLANELRGTWPIYDNLGPVTRLQRERIHEAADALEAKDARIEQLEAALREARNSIWALKELANGLGETLIESEAERLLSAQVDGGVS